MTLVKFWSGSVTWISNEPLSDGTAPSANRTTIVVFLLHVGKTFSTTSSLGVMFHRFESPLVSTDTLNDSIAVALFSIFSVTLPDEPGRSTT